MNAQNDMLSVQQAEKKGTHLSNEDIYEKIYNAICERNLPPGTKLNEEKLAKVFNVSRTRIREVLCRLSFERIVSLVPNRGASVARPTIKETRNVFEARSAIESTVVRNLAKVAETSHIAALKAHLARESDARSKHDRRLLTKLSGDFHLLIADLAGNPILGDSIKSLVSLTSLIIYLYESPLAPPCTDHDHEDLVEAIAMHDAEKAAKLMCDHLKHVEDSLLLTDEQEVDLEKIFT